MKNPRELVQYYIVNKDVGMGKGKVAAQVAHAATIFAYRRMHSIAASELIEDCEEFREWYWTVQKKIVLKAPLELLEKYEELGHIAIRDKGYTQIPEGTLTVVCIGVLARDKVPEDVKELPLL